MPVGTFDITAEIHETQGAFATPIVTKDFDSFQPSEEQYMAFDLKAAMEKAKSVGDSALVAQLVAADVNAEV